MGARAEVPEACCSVGARVGDTEGAGEGAIDEGWFAGSEVGAALARQCDESEGSDAKPSRHTHTQPIIARTGIVE